MMLRRALAVAVALLTLAALGGIDAAHAGRIRGFKADAKEIAKTGGTRYRVVVVVSDDAVANQVDQVKVTLRPVGDAPPPLTASVLLPLKVVKDNGNKRFVNSHLAFAGDPLGASYVIGATMLDVDGAAVGETVTSTVQVDQAGAISLPSVAIRQLDATSFKLRVVVAGDDELEVHRVDVTFVDVTGPAPRPTELRLVDPTVEDDRRIFVLRTLTFEKPAAAIGVTYDVVLDLKDDAGRSLGVSRERVVVEAR